MQNPNQSLHLQRAQISKEKRKISDEKSENRPRENNKLAPMSTEMREVLAGLARFDLLPEKSQQNEELVLLPEINKKQTGFRKAQQVSTREKYFPNVNKARNVDTSSRFSGKTDIYLSTSSKFAKPKILIDEIDNESKSKQDCTRESPSQHGSGRFRSITYPYKSHNVEHKKDELLSKMQSHLLSREKMRNSSEQSGFNELKLDGPRRPRAATFPYYQLKTSEVHEKLCSAHDDVIRRKAGSSLSDASKQSPYISKPEGKTTSKDEMTAIVHRCEEWFLWRERRQKLEKSRR